MNLLHLNVKRATWTMSSFIYRHKNKISTLPVSSIEKGALQSALISTNITLQAVSQVVKPWKTILVTGSLYF